MYLQRGKCGERRKYPRRLNMCVFRNTTVWLCVLACVLGLVQQMLHV